MGSGITRWSKQELDSSSFSLDKNSKQYNALINSINSEEITQNYKNKILGLFKRLIIYSNKYYNTSNTILKYVENFKESKQKKRCNFSHMKNI